MLSSVQNYDKIAIDQHFFKILLILLLSIKAVFSYDGHIYINLLKSLICKLNHHIISIHLMSKVCVTNWKIEFQILNILSNLNTKY